IQKLLVIGEAAKNIPEPMKEQYPDIPWKRMAGMRDRLIHAYFGMDAQLIWQTIHEDLPALKERLSEILGKP
ncbi:MAG: HepT-like ribonuclease domain-containing protein, partial [bacterium]